MTSERIPLWQAAVAAVGSFLSAAAILVMQFRRQDADRRREQDAERLGVVERLNQRLIEFTDKSVLAVQAEVASLRDELNVERKARVAAEDRNSQLQKRIDELVDQITALQREAVTREQRISELESEIATVRAATGIDDDRRKGVE